MEIRMATVADAEEMLEIYTPYVTDTAITFEYDTPTIEDFRGRVERTLQRYPWLVATEKGKILGYAYAGAFHPRAAYQHSAELSVYLRMDERGKGLGRKMYDALTEILLKQNVYLLHACIAVADPEDEYLTNDSEKFHLALGFAHSARHDRIGYKFGRWYGMIWMDKEIHPRDADPKAFVALPDIE